ncbi:rac GTPase-activating protein 1 isoform X3 [Anolis carolinensis]|uniref:rac GTPase-activating protein 1 isoform X3 n=1 Tax=Anolis carolinensis TaxID=28377 RepID=UPI002F2B44CE
MMDPRKKHDRSVRGRGISRMNRLGPQIMHRLDQLLEFINFNSNIELDYLQIARSLEVIHQRCLQLDRDLKKVQEQLRQSEFERSGLEVKLKHARNQVEVEMKKRHGAEAELEKQERKLKLIYAYLMTDSQTAPLSEDQCFCHSTLLPGKCCMPGDVLSAVEELGASCLSDISFDRSDDEIERGTRPVKSRDRRRSSLAPLIQPIVAAKRTRPSVTASSNSSPVNGIPVMTLKTGVIAENSSVPIAAIFHRRSQPNHQVSTNSDLPTIRDRTEDSPGCSTQARNDVINTATGSNQRSAQETFTPPPPQEIPTFQQHHFTSKRVIRLECCAVCKSRLHFGKMALKCRPCQLQVHPECKERCLVPCTPGAHPTTREGTLADFAPPTPPLVPPIVIQCVNQVEKRGLRETGLYRVPGAEHLVREWKNKLLTSQKSLPSLDDVADVNVICGILKDFLRNLKEPLVTFCLHSAFLHAIEIPDDPSRHTALCHVVMKLPVANRDTLAFLMLHLHRVMQSPECRMDQNNLARIFGPTLVGHSTPNPTPLTIMKDTPRQCRVKLLHFCLPGMVPGPRRQRKPFHFHSKEATCFTCHQELCCHPYHGISAFRLPVSPGLGLVSSQSRARCVT